MKVTITGGSAGFRVKEGVVPTQYVYTRGCHWEEYLGRECRHSPERRAVRKCVLLARGTGLLQHIGTLSWKYLIICRACARVPVRRCGSESVCAHACLVLVVALLVSLAKTDALVARKSCAVFMLRSFGPMGR